ncbi:hypothetical protein F7647_03030 [Tenacibaculum piscium]|uniref:hypothetical protein n=1 Tax=Tenacibaculum piscium TaxID=1458515 RepID=UPI00187B22F6|nr:hypothetical protein [Tenacibaculum piscium]MBE7685032.1 hypothetical protein [Tenacibaculum piscium]
MNTLKIIVTTIFLTFILGIQQTTAQNEIKTLKNKISADEEVLMSGIKALKRVNANLENFKKSRKATKENIARKEYIVNNIQEKLTKLNAKINRQKEELLALEIKSSKTIEQPKKEQEKQQEKQQEITVKNKKIKPTEKPKKINVTKPIQDTNNTINELALRKQKLEEARIKLEEERKAKEIAYLKEQETLHLEAEKLKQLGNQIKAEEKSIIKEKGTLISDYEDAISINQEILISGKEGLARMKTKLKNAKLDPTTSKESITRKEAIIIKIEERLNNIQAEITAKELELAKLKK